MQATEQLKPIFKKLKTIWAPPPDLTVDSWADQYRKLSPESSAEPGNWKTDRVPFQREIMKTFSDPKIETVVFMKSAQVGATELLNNILGFYIDQEPSPILILQPTLQMSQAYSKDRVAPMLRDTPKLKNKVKDPASRSAENTTLHKKFPGGHLTIVGANSSSGLASRPIRILLCDEVDRYPLSAGTEGDPINLAKKRTTTFWNRKIFMCSTPTIKGVSRIEKAYEESDKRVYKVPCPECNHKQELKWKQITWPENKPEKAELACGECGAIIPESKKQWMILNGEWEATGENKKVAGFHISELYSPFRTWGELAEDFLEAKKSPELLQTFVNTTLGELWEEQGEEIIAEGLMEKCENYNHEAIPDEVLLLTAGVDTQKDRLEVQVIGWGDNFEAWVVEYKIIWGNPATKEPWQELDNYLKYKFDKQNGKKLFIAATCIDSGGHHTEMVYDYTRARNARRIFSIKGQSIAGKPIIGKASWVGKKRVALYPVGSDTAKEWIHARLKEDSNLIHFPNTIDEEYFKQLTAEKRIPKIHRGKKTLVWKQTRERNEALDTFVYSLAAAHLLQPNFEKLRLERSTNKEKKKENNNNSYYNRRLMRRNPRNFVTSWSD